MTCIIAEAGVNHNGSAEMALKLVDAAAEAGADAVKFQTFRADRLAGRGAPKAEYQKKATGGGEDQLRMLSGLEISRDTHEALLARCRSRGIQFLSSPFDEESLDLLTDGLGLRTVKFASGEITNGPLLLRAAGKGVSLILSTGMSTLGEVEEALSCLAFGFTAAAGVPPSREGFLRAYASPEGRRALSEKVILLHCTTEYPAPAAEVNLRGMGVLRDAFGLPAGYSDHTEGIAVSIAAAALGAAVIEKHFTLDRTLPGPDHRASLEPAELRAMVRAVRDVEAALGDGLKVPSPSEWGNRDVARKSLVASRPVAEGEEFTADNLAAKRPGGGRSPMDFWSLLGTRAPKSLGKDEMVP